MAILDKELLFTGTAAAPDQAITATAISTNVYDTGPLATGNAGIDWGVGMPLEFSVLCIVAMTDAGSDSTVTVTVETDDNAALTSATVIETFPVFAALAAIGARRRLTVNIGLAWERFIGLRFTVANGNLSTGSFRGWAAPLGHNSALKKFAIGSNFF